MVILFYPCYHFTMKLYLSSYGLGNRPEKLKELVGKNKLAAIIVNAQDLADEEKRLERLRLGIEEMTSLGFQSEELDLRDFFTKPDELASHLHKYGLLWIRGGNAFVLQRAMQQSSFDVSVQELVRSESLVLAGSSAGSCAATTTLHGVELVDDSVSVPDGYTSDIVWEGLNFVHYSIAPHYRSDHPESEAIENTVHYFKSHGMPYKTLHDGQAIVINGKNEEITN